MKVSNPSANYPKWSPGQAGYDEDLRKFRDPVGRNISKAKYVEDYYFAVRRAGSEAGMVTASTFMPESIEYERLGRIMGGIGDAVNRKAQWSKAFTMPKAWPMPTNIATAMRWAEYFMAVEGDVFQALTIPMQLAFSRSLSIKSPSPEFERELGEFYDVDQLDIQTLMQDVWLCDETYSNTVPAIMPSGNNDSPIYGVTILPPRYTYIGTPGRSSLGSAWPSDNPLIWTPEMSKAMGGTMYGLMSQTEQAWTAELYKSEVKPIAYNLLASNPNEQAPSGFYIEINPQLVHPIQYLKQRWENYAMPQMMRAFNAITTRRVASEMRRGTFEGFKNQLIIFNVGTDEKPGTPEEVEHMAGLLNATSGERTGQFVWRGNLHPTAFTIQAVDSLMANETHWQLTIDIFRRLGINPRFIAGEPAGRISPGDDLDIQIFVERLRWKMARIAAWERWFRIMMARMWYPGDAKIIEVARQTTVELQMPMVELATMIRSYLMPLFQAGAMSLKTLHGMAGLSNATEIANRKSEQGEIDALFQPHTVFSQTATDKQGDTKTTESQSSPGRPRTDGQPPDKAVAGDNIKGGAEPDYADFLASY